MNGVIKEVQMGFYFAEIVTGDYLSSLFKKTKPIREINKDIHYAILKYDTDNEPELYYPEIDYNKNVYGSGELVNCNISDSIVEAKIISESKIYASIVLCGAANISRSTIDFSFVKNSTIKDSKIYGSLIGNCTYNNESALNSIYYDNKSYCKKADIVSLNLCGFQTLVHRYKFKRVLENYFRAGVIVFQEADKVSRTSFTNCIALEDDEELRFGVRNDNGVYYHGIRVTNVHAKANDKNDDSFNPEFSTNENFVLIGDFNRNATLMKLKEKYDKSSGDIDKNSLEQVISTIPCTVEKVKIPYLDKKNHDALVVRFEKYRKYYYSCDECEFDASCPEDESGPRPNACDCPHFSKRDNMTFDSEYDLDNIGR